MRLGARARFSRSIFVAWTVACAIAMAVPGRAQSVSLTFEEIKAISPNAQDAFVQAIVESESEFAAAGITTRLRMAHFLAQVMTETGGLKRLDENMNYSFETLLRVFSRRTISEAKAREIARKPVEIANWVYGERLGNLGRTTMDGWNYRGSGFIQLTGRANFRDRGREVGLPLEDQPDLAREARAGLQAALAYWTARRINVAADDHDHLRVRVLVNGPAAHGHEQARVWFNRAWTRVFRNKPEDGSESALESAGGLDDEGELFDSILQESGLLALDGLATEAGTEAARADALRSFQREVGLPETGVLDEATQEELLDPREWRYRDGLTERRAEAETDPERSVVFLLNAAGSGTGTESGAVIELTSAEGSGVTVSNPNLDQETQTLLGDASGIYAEYEMGGATVEPSRFQPHSVIGTDERRAVMPTTGFPARAIVQILFHTEFGAEHLCSGAMISPDTVLTAGHCIHSGTPLGRAYRNFRVIPGRNVGAAPFGQCGATKAFVIAGWTGSLTSEEARYFDLGGLKLDCDVGNVTGWFGVRMLGEDETGLATVVQGYAADLAPPGRQWISHDELRLLWDLKGFYQNDTYGGTSGSPVFADGTPNVIIGVHTNGLHGEEPWASHNAFTRITPDRLAVIQGWIEE